MNIAILQWRFLDFSPVQHYSIQLVWAAARLSCFRLWPTTADCSALPRFDCKTVNVSNIAKWNSAAGVV